MKIGYARTSTLEQNLDLQRDALKSFGCDKMFADQTSGVKSSRPGLDQLLEIMRPGDTIVVWRLDRLGRSLKDLISLIDRFKNEHIGFVSIEEKIDTTTVMGEFMFHMMGALAQFERGLTIERVQAGLQAARARGRMGGAKWKVNPNKRKLAVELYRAREKSIIEILDIIGISRSTLYKYIKEAGCE